jgi:hypothetical protein
MLAEMLAAGMNCNVGGRDHAAVYVERQAFLHFNFFITSINFLLLKVRHLIK